MRTPGMDSWVNISSLPRLICKETMHYRKTLIRRVPEFLPCAFYRAHNKEMICRVSARKHTANTTHTANRALHRVPSPSTRRTWRFAVCQPASTRRTWITCLALSSAVKDRVMASRPSLFAVCQSQAHGELKSSPCAICLAHGEHYSPVTRRQGRHYLSCVQVTAPSLFVVCPGWHTANMDLCRVPGLRHTAKIVFAVCLSRKHKKKIHVFASKCFLHSPYFVWYSMFEYDIFIDILVVFN